jgi:apolipoprotein N-acyltransferase
MAGSRGQILLGAAATLLSALLFHFAFPPRNFSLGIWFALLPILFLAGGYLRKPWVWILLAAVIVSVDLHRWLAVFHPLATVFYLLYCGGFGFFLPILVFSLIAKRSRLGAALAFPALWTIIEYLRTEQLFRFGFGGLAYSQAFTPLPIQIADLTGVYGVSWLIAAVNAAAWYLIAAFAAPRGQARKGSDAHPALILGGATLLALALSLGYGAWKLSLPLSPTGISVELAQYDHAERKAYSELEGSYLEEYARLAAAPSERPVDLVVFPENAVLRPLSLDPARQPAGSLATLNRLSGMARDSRRAILFGVLERDWKGETGILRNSAFLFDSKGDLAGRYRKRLLAPFGETDPFGGLFPAFDRLVMSLTDAVRLTPGEGASTLAVADSSGRNHPFGLLICYEGTSGALVREYGRLGAEFLVNITSDRWTNDTGALMQHAAFSVFRAVENRRALVRVGNGGLSCAIDPLGRVVAGMPVFATGTAVWGIPTIDVKQTAYSRHGDWIIGAAALLFLSAAGATILVGASTKTKGGNP